MKKHARAFYALILVSTAVGVGLDFVGINPVKVLLDSRHPRFAMGMDRRRAHHRG